MRDYLTPDFDVTVYEVEDIITISSIGTKDPDDNGSGDSWWNA